MLIKVKGILHQTIFQHSAKSPGHDKNILFLACDLFLCRLNWYISVIAAFNITISGLYQKQLIHDLRQRLPERMEQNLILILHKVAIFLMNCKTEASPFQQQEQNGEDESGSLSCHSMGKEEQQDDVSTREQRELNTRFIYRT